MLLLGKMMAVNAEDEALLCFERLAFTNGQLWLGVFATSFYGIARTTLWFTITSIMRLWTTRFFPSLEMVVFSRPDIISETLRHVMLGHWEGGRYTVLRYDCPPLPEANHKNAHSL